MAKEVITSLNVKNSDGSFNNIPIGVKAEEVKLKNGKDLETSIAFLEDSETEVIEFESQKVPLYEEDVVDNLSTLSDSPLSAKQGAILNSRINNLAGFNGSLSDREIADLRVGANGKTYSTAGDAVRENINLLKTEELPKRESISRKVDKKDSNGTWVLSSSAAYYPSINYLNTYYLQADEVKTLIEEAKYDKASMAELTDLRVGADGNLYQTAGAAVRINIQDTNKKVEELSDTINLKADEKYLRPFINIEDFGAMAEASNYDNSVAIKAAIMFAQEKRGIVYIPNKNYYIDSTITLEEFENIEIINDGIFIVNSKALREGSLLSTAFSFKKCKNIYFSVGKIKSSRNQTGKAPVDHTREDYNSSNIIGIHVNESENIIIDNYTSENLEYAFVIDTDDGKYSKKILLKNLKSYETSQPVYGSHFQDFKIENMYAESCLNCGSGDHFIYISKYSKNFSVNKAEFVYKDKFYGPAINLRNAYTAALMDGNETKLSYDDSQDLDIAYLNDITIKDCIWFVSAKAKTKVYINNCNIQSTELEKQNCLYPFEYANMYIKDSILQTAGDLLILPNKTNSEIKFENCVLKCEKILSGGKSGADVLKYSKSILFDNCNIECTGTTAAPIWLNWNCDTEISFKNSSLQSDYAYLLYLGNSNINYDISNCKFKGNNLLVNFSEDYTPTQNVKIRNCLCQDIKTLCKSTKIINSGNVLNYDDTVDDLDKDLLITKADLNKTKNYLELSEGTYQKNEVTVTIKDNYVYVACSEKTTAASTIDITLPKNLSNSDKRYFIVDNINLGSSNTSCVVSLRNSLTAAAVTSAISITSAQTLNTEIPENSTITTLRVYVGAGATTNKKFQLAICDEQNSKYISPYEIQQLKNSHSIGENAITPDFKEIINNKYDSSNIEYGSGILSPAQTIYEGNEGNFNYAKIGNIVTVAVNMTKIVSGKSYIQMTGLPFAAKTASRLSSFTVYSTNNSLRNVRIDGSWLYISSPTDTFVEDEKLNFIITYIKQ